MPGDEQQETAIRKLLAGKISIRGQAIVILIYPDFLFGRQRFMNTNREAHNLDELKDLASSELFAGSGVRVADESQNAAFEPSVRERTSTLFSAFQPRFQSLNFR